MSRIMPHVPNEMASAPAPVPDRSCDLQDVGHDAKAAAERERYKRDVFDRHPLRPLEA
jgi:hypothetical protein